MSGLLVAEPTYRDGEHAAVNAAILQAAMLACGPFPFAATRAQQDAVREASDPGDPAPSWREIEVLPPGGVQLRRMRAQWRTLAPLVAAQRPRTLLLLSAGPETLFVMRGLVTRHRALRILAVMHGNLATATGWRSRDPRRRLIDLRAGLTLARHPRIGLIVLEEHIRTAALRHRLGEAFLVWPTPVLANEAAALRDWRPGARLRVAFVGTANRHKGFDDFLALRGSARDCDLAVVGRPSGEYGPADLAGIEVPPARLARAAFLCEIRRADYAFMAFRDEYAFTASGSLLDCINQRTPLIALRNEMLSGLERQHGPIGFLCADMAEVHALFDSPARLRDAAAHARFRQSLDAIARTRLPQGLAATLRRDLAC